jgi:hypothetical protein
MIVVVMFAAVGTAVALTSGDVSNLKKIRTKANSIIATAQLLSSQVSDADKAVIVEHAQAIVDEVNALLTPSLTPPPTTPPPTSPPPTSPPPTGQTHIVDAGDIADASDEDLKTSDLVLSLDPALVLMTGDMCDGACDPAVLSDLMMYYDPTWGRFRDKTFPTTGNGEYHLAGAPGFSQYWRIDPVGIRSLVLGDWLIVALNSQNGISAQASALQGLLAADEHTCELLFWHKPRYSSGYHGDNTAMEPFWAVASANNVDVVLNGHDHIYERFAQQRGPVRQFTVGMGGNPTGKIFAIAASSEVRITGDENHGVLDLGLNPTSYDWRFIRASDRAVLDSGSTACA